MEKANILFPLWKYKHLHGGKQIPMGAEESTSIEANQNHGSKLTSTLVSYLLPWAIASMELKALSGQ